MLAAPGIHPVPQGPVVDPQVPGHLRDRLAGRDHHLHGLSLELRAELAAMLRHETDPLSRAESHCPRSLIHLRVPNLALIVFMGLSRTRPTLARERAGRVGIGQGELILCAGEMIAEESTIELLKPPREIRSNCLTARPW